MDKIYIIAIVVILLIIYCYVLFVPATPKTTIIWFYSKSCGHCTKMEPAWQQFTAKCPRTIAIKKINTAENKQMATDYGVDGVPYIVKEDLAGVRTVYDGDRSSEDLYRFATE